MPTLKNTIIIFKPKKELQKKQDIYTKKTFDLLRRALPLKKEELRNQKICALKEMICTSYVIVSGFINDITSKGLECPFLMAHPDSQGENDPSDRRGGLN